LQTREPIFNVPGTVLVLLAVLILIHACRQFLPQDAGEWFVFAMAFIPARYAGMAAELPGGETAAVTSLVTHMLVHSDVTHLVFNSAWLLAFGSILNKRMGAARFLVFSLAGGIAGIVLFYALRPALATAVIGASGAIAAMMGGVLRFMFVALDRHQAYLLRDDPAAIPRMSLDVALRDRRINLTTIVFIIFNLVGFVGLGSIGADIAWEAHLGGYFFGLLCFGMFDGAPQKAKTYPPEVE
jgi:membrane associated rhomboid family serine protease